MRANKEQRIDLARSAVYAAPIIFFATLLLIDVNPSGTRLLSYEVSRPSAMISALFPADRLEGVSARRQRLMREPVYFRVRYPHRYRTATVVLEVENPGNLPWRIGMETEGGGWAYIFAEPDADGGASFQLAQARVTDRTLRFLIAVPGLTDSREFSVRSVRVILTRPPLWESILKLLL